MRTTVSINDHLLTEAKSVAAHTHRSLGEVIDDALHGLLIQRHDILTTSRTLSLPTDGGSGLVPGVDLEDKEQLAEILGDNSRSC